MVIKCLINEECQIKTGHVTWQRKKKKESYDNLSLHKTAFHSFLLYTPGKVLPCMFLVAQFFLLSFQAGNHLLGYSRMIGHGMVS